MKKLIFIGLGFCFFSTSYAQGPIGTPTAMVWGGMPYGNVSAWSSQLHHYSQGPAVTSGYYDPSIERGRIYNDYYKAEMYWKKKDLWDSHNPPAERRHIEIKPFDPESVYAEGRVLWPVIFKDKRFRREIAGIEKILRDRSDRQWKDIEKFLDLIGSMHSKLMQGIRTYPASYYGEGAVFLDQLKRII